MSTPDPTGPAGPPTRPSASHRPAWLAALGRRRWIAALLALVLVAAAGIAVFSLNRAGRDAAPAATQTQSPSETPTPTPTPSETPPPAPALASAMYCSTGPPGTNWVTTKEIGRAHV